MATQFTFDNKLIKLPGAYSTIKSGIKNIPAGLSYGNILIIDCGGATGYGGGAGIDGTLADGQNSVYSFDNIGDFQSFIKGGYYWLLAYPLFQPSPGEQGVSRIYWTKAAATVAAEMTFAPTGGGSAGGTWVIQCRDEGTVGNGAETSSVLTKGYCYTFSAGEIDNTKFLLKFWRGTFKGLASDGLAYDGIAEANCKPELVAKSPEFSNIQEVFDWAATDVNFNVLFKSKTTTKTGTGAITSADLSSITGNRLASGGTETYSTTYLSQALEAVKDLDYTFVLADKHGVSGSTDNMQSAENGLIFAHITNEAKFQKFMVVGGGLDATQFVQSTLSSKAAAEYFNSDRVIVVHGGVKKVSQLTGSGFREFDSLYKASVVLGRIAGLAPQVPITFKSIGIDGEIHSLNSKEKTKALQSGVLCTYWDDDFKSFTVLQGVNTLQNNTYLVNADGTSYSIQLKRIESQINKEIIINAKKDLLGQRYGVNRNTLSEGIVRDWLISFLDSRTAKGFEDNLIISFPKDQVVVTRKQDAYDVRYAFSPNTEITKLFFTGTMID